MGMLMDMLGVLTEAPVVGEDDYRRNDLGEYDTPLYRTLSGTLGMGVVGAMLGNIKCRYDYQMPTKNKQLLRVINRGYMKDYGLTMAVIGCSYTLADSLMEKYRGKRDFVNSIYAGFAAGAAYGLRVGSIPKGLGAAASFAVVTALVDVAGNTTRKPTAKEFLPYPEDY